MTLAPYIANYTARQRSQLVRKFQLTHYIASTCKIFKTFETFSHFERTCHDVDLGTGHLRRQDAAEMAKYIGISKRIKNVTEPLNENILNYYSVLCDGSSSTKIVDEKELYVIKTCVNGKPKFDIMSLEEPEEGNAPGLKVAMEHSHAKMQFSFDRATKEIGMCSDAAAVNVALHKLVKEELGPHYMLMLCPSHKYELAINDAFNLVQNSA